MASQFYLTEADRNLLKRYLDLASKAPVSRGLGNDAPTYDGSPEIYIAKVPFDTGLPGRDGSKPGTADCELFCILATGDLLETDEGPLELDDGELLELETGEPEGDPDDGDFVLEALEEATEEEEEEEEEEPQPKPTLVKVFNIYQTPIIPLDESVARYILVVKDKYGRWVRTISEEDSQLFLVRANEDIPAREDMVCGSGNVTLQTLSGNGTITSSSRIEKAYNFSGRQADSGDLLACNREVSSGLLLVHAEDCFS